MNDLRNTIESFGLTNGNNTSPRAIQSRILSQETAPRSPYHPQLRSETNSFEQPRPIPDSVDHSKATRGSPNPVSQTASTAERSPIQKASPVTKAKEVVGLTTTKPISDVTRKPSNPDSDKEISEKERTDGSLPLHSDKIDASALRIDTTGDDDRIKEYARDIFNCTESLVSFSDASSWLMSTDEFNSRVRIAYMELFDFMGLDILTAVRRLCARLHLKGESQQLDRILEALGMRWYGCNPENGMKDPGLASKTSD